MNYEFWYNWEYAKRHNPKLMCIGTTGGFGAIRMRMRECVHAHNQKKAEECFWSLIDQTIAEMQYDALEEGGRWRDMMNDWLTDVYNRPGVEYNEEIAHFVRPKWRTPMMHDTLMDLEPDDLCIPCIRGLKIDPSKTFAQEYRDYLEWVHNDQPFIDPMDPANIY